LNIIAVDWAKGAAKRSAYQARLDTRSISRLAIDGSLAQLIDHASSLNIPALIGINAAIGFPMSSWKRLNHDSDNQPGHFIDYLLNGPLPSRFFDPVTKLEEWSPQRPFIRPPAGKWSLKAFVEASDGGLYRKNDSTLNGSSIFVTSGLPGSVGSGTRALWQELVALCGRPSFSVWPFHGPLDTLLKNGKPVIAEIYPKACYGIALAESLPTPLLTIAKTRENARRDTLARLRDSHWVERERIIIEDLEVAVENEDDFDALMSAAAMMRMFLENSPLESPQATETKIEGGVLGAASLNTSTRKLPRLRMAKPVNQKAVSTGAVRKRPCPIAGCTHVFHNSRGGWDTHVASFPRHPRWHPGIHDPAQRKQLFKQEFPSWFRN